MRILLVRHGESQGNVDPLAYGRIGDPHISLTEEGWRQVLRMGDFLASFYKENPCEGHDYPQAVDTSTWVRAVQTEEAGVRHFRSNTHIRFRRDDALREQSFGLLYRTETRCDRGLRTKLRAAARDYRENPFEAVPPEGESPVMHYTRVRPVAQKILNDPVVRDRVVFSHGATNRHIITIALNLPPTAWKQIENQGNGDVTLLENRGQGFTVRKIYDGVTGRPVDYNPLRPSLMAGLPAPT